MICSDCLNEKLELRIRSKAVAVGRWDRRDLERVKFSGERARVSFVQLNVEIEQEGGVERSVLVQGYSAHLNVSHARKPLSQMTGRLLSASPPSLSQVPRTPWIPPEASNSFLPPDFLQVSPMTLLSGPLCQRCVQGCLNHSDIENQKSLSTKHFILIIVTRSSQELSEADTIIVPNFQTVNQATQR